MSHHEIIAFLHWLIDEQELDGLKEADNDIQEWLSDNGFEARAIIDGLDKLRRQENWSVGLIELLQTDQRQAEWIRWCERALATLDTERVDLKVAGGTYPTTGLWKATKKSFSHDSQENRSIAAQKEGGFAAFQYNIDCDIQHDFDHYVKDEIKQIFPHKEIKYDWKNNISHYSSDIIPGNYLYTIKGPKRTIKIEYEPFGLTETNNTAESSPTSYYGLDFSIHFENKNGQWKTAYFTIGNLVFKNNSYDKVGTTVWQNNHWQDWYIAKAQNNYGQQSKYTGMTLFQIVHQSSAGRLIIDAKLLMNKAKRVWNDPFVKFLVMREWGTNLKLEKACKYLNWLDQKEYHNFDKRQKYLFAVDLVLATRLLNHIQDYPKMYNYSRQITKRFTGISSKITPWYIYQKSFQRYLSKILPIKLADKFDLPLEDVEKKYLASPEYKEGDIKVTNTVATTTLTLDDGSDTASVEYYKSFNPKDKQHIVSINVHNKSKVDDPTGRALEIDVNTNHIKKHVALTWLHYKARSAEYFDFQGNYRSFKQFYALTENLVSHPLARLLLLHDSKELLIESGHAKQAKTFMSNNNTSASQFFKTVNECLVYLGGIDLRALDAKQDHILAMDYVIMRVMLHQYQAQIEWMKKVGAAFSTNTQQKINSQQDFEKVVAQDLRITAWKQLSNGTYRVVPSPLPKYVQIINRFGIHAVYRRNIFGRYTFSVTKSSNKGVDKEYTLDVDGNFTKTRNGVYQQGAGVTVQLTKTTTNGASQIHCFITAWSFPQSKRTNNPNPAWMFPPEYYFSLPNKETKGSRIAIDNQAAIALQFQDIFFKSKEGSITIQAFNDTKNVYKHAQKLLEAPFVKAILSDDVAKMGLSSELKYCNNTASSIYSYLDRLSKINLSSLSKRQIRKWSQMRLSLKLSLLVDTLLIRNTARRLWNQHKNLVDHAQMAGSAFVKITPDEIYQKTFEHDLIDRVEKHGVRNMLFRALGKQALWKASNGYVFFRRHVEVEEKGGNQVVIGVNKPNSLDTIQVQKNFILPGFTVTKTEYLFNGSTPISNTYYVNESLKSLTKGIIVNRLETKYAIKEPGQIVQLWEQSIYGKKLSIEYKQGKAFYKHSTWLLSFAFIGRIIRFDSTRYLDDHLRVDPAKQFRANQMVFTLYNAFGLDFAKGLNNDIRELGEVSFVSLNERKKIVLAIDAFSVIEYYKLMAGSQFRSSVKTMQRIYPKIYALAEDSMKLTPAVIYQRRFETRFRAVGHFEKAFNYQWKQHVSAWHGGEDKALYFDFEGWRNSGNYEILNWNTEHKWYVNTTKIKRAKSKLSSLTEKELRLKSLYNSSKEVYKSVIQLSAYLQNSVLSSCLQEYVERHNKVNSFFKWLPSARSLNTLIQAVSAINFQSLKKSQQFLLVIDAAVLNHYIKDSVSSRFINEVKGAALAIVECNNKLSSRLKPGAPKIKRDYEFIINYGSPDGKKHPAQFNNVKSEIYSYKHPKGHKWKKVKQHNEKVLDVYDALVAVDLEAFKEELFINIEKQALESADRAYKKAILNSDNKKQALRLADKSYLQTLRVEDEIILAEVKRFNIFTLNTYITEQATAALPNFDFRFKKLNTALTREAAVLFYFTEKPFIGDLGYREMKATQKLFRIQNDRYARKLRLKFFLDENKLVSNLAVAILKYSPELGTKILSHLEQRHFWKTLGEDIAETLLLPFIMGYTFSKDLVNGDGFFKSWEASFGVGYKILNKDINGLVDILKIGEDWIDDTILALERYIVNPIFKLFLPSGSPVGKFLHNVEDDLNKTGYILEKTFNVIAKAVADIPLHLLKDVNDLIIQMAQVLEGKSTIRKEFMHDIHGPAETLKRLGKLTYHITTGKFSKIGENFKTKYTDIRTLLEFRVKQKMIKVAIKDEKEIMRIRRGLHRDTFGLVRSPMQKFKERHKNQYINFVHYNKSLIASGYFDSHLHEMVLEKDLTAINKALIKAPAWFAVQEELLNAKINSEFSTLTPKQQIADIKGFNDGTKTLNISKSKTLWLVRHDLAKEYPHIDFHKVIQKQKQDLQYWKKHNKPLVIAVYMVSMAESWEENLIKKQKCEIAFLAKHPRIIVAMSATKIGVKDIYQEQQKINNDWSSWGIKRGKMVFTALTMMLPDMTVTLKGGLDIKVIKSSTDMTGKEIKAWKSFDNKHLVGKKIFDITMWGLLLVSISGKYSQLSAPVRRWSLSKSEQRMPELKLVASAWATGNARNEHTAKAIKKIIRLDNAIMYILETPISELVDIKRKRVPIFMKNNELIRPNAFAIQEVFKSITAEKKFKGWKERTKKQHTVLWAELSADKTTQQDGGNLSVADVLDSFMAPPPPVPNVNSGSSTSGSGNTNGGAGGSTGSGSSGKAKVYHISLLMLYKNFELTELIAKKVKKSTLAKSELSKTKKVDDNVLKKKETDLELDAINDVDTERKAGVKTMKEEADGYVEKEFDAGAGKIDQAIDSAPEKIMKNEEEVIAEDEAAELL